MNIHVFGLGTIGSPLIIDLINQYPENSYYGLDFDKVEDRNIKTQAYFIPQIGMPKANAISILANQKVRKPKYTPINRKLTEHLSESEWADKLTSSNDLFIDCFDNSASRKLLYANADQNVLHVGFSPFYTAEIIWQDKYDVPGDVDSTQADICDMEDAVLFTRSIVNFASGVISNYIRAGVKDSYIITNKTKVRKI